jgi:hypothetical protein
LTGLTLQAFDNMEYEMKCAGADDDVMLLRVGPAHTVACLHGPDSSRRRNLLLVQAKKNSPTSMTSYTTEQRWHQIFHYTLKASERASPFCVPTKRDYDVTAGKEKII